MSTTRLNLCRVPNAGGGDCLFYVIVQSQEIPPGLTMAQAAQKVRGVAAQLATAEEFRVKRGIYLEALAAKKPTQAQIEDLHKYAWLKNVHSLRQYKVALLNRDAWGDGETIVRLEKAYNCRILLMEPHGAAYRWLPGDFSQPIRPDDLCILVHYDRGNHYELLLCDGMPVTAFCNFPARVQAVFSI